MFAAITPSFGLDCAAAARPPRPPAMVSRVGMRQLLMREQMQQEEQRERQRHLHHIQHRPPGPPASSPAINAPVHFPAPMQVPVEVLKVTSMSCTWYCGDVTLS